MRVTSRVKEKIRFAGGVEYRIRAENESSKIRPFPPCFVPGGFAMIKAALAEAAKTASKGAL
jgi:hypothetical protein